MLNAHIEVRESRRFVAGNPIPYLNNLRDSKNAEAGHQPGRTAWPSGKIEFASFVTQNGGRAPQSLAIILDGRVAAGVFGVGESSGSFLKRLPPGRYFCKPNRATRGSGGFALDVSASQVTVNGEAQSLALIEVLLSQGPYVVQVSLTPLQHTEIARFNARAINTLRLVTFDREAGPGVIAASLRMGTANAAVDNWSAGGVAVPVDLERGVLGEFGVFKKDLAVVDAHPQSGQPFRDRSVPHFHEAARMACSLHQKLDLASMGWDIALLQDGPCIIEANRQWDVFLAAQFTPAFLHTFLELHLARGTEPARMDLTGAFGNRAAIRLWLSTVMGDSRVSARVDEVSNEHLAVTVGGSRMAIETAMETLRRSPSEFGIREIRSTPAQKEPALGLDISKTFSS